VQAFANVGRALASAGARPDEVAKLTIFVVNLEPESLSAIEAGRVALFKQHKPVDALIGVKTLAHPGCLIEVEAIAVVDDAQYSNSARVFEASAARALGADRHSSVRGRETEMHRGRRLDGVLRSCVWRVRAVA
jgi:hypothetical protein